MESSVRHVLEKIEKKFIELLKNPEIYIEPQPQKSNIFKQLSKKAYSTAVNNNEKYKGRALSKLLVDGFDDEQIWQQSDLLNKAALSNITQAIHNINAQSISRAASKSRGLKLSLGKKGKISKGSKDRKTFADSNNISSEESNVEEEYAFDDDSDSDLEKSVSKTASNVEKDDDDDVSDSELIKALNKASNADDYDFDDDSELEKDAKLTSSDVEEEGALDDELNSPSKIGKNLKKLPKLKYKSEVDDKFFKLSKLEEFLRIEDLKEEKGVENVSDDEINFFEDIPSDDGDFDEESEDDEEKTKKSSRYYYEDFFDAPESEVEDGCDDGMEEEKDPMDENMDYTPEGEDNLYEKNGETDPEGEDDLYERNGETDLEGEDDLYKNGETDPGESEKNADNKSSRKTPFELEQEMIKQLIQDIEKSRLQPMPWHLTGEVDASKRPIDSLVDHEADFDSNAKKDFICDKTLTERIEEIVKMAKRNKTFMDVERQYKPTEELINYKRELALDQTKSKKSLAEVYEEEYLKKQSKQDEEEEDPKHKEIEKQRNLLFPKLHALFSHIPKPAVPEIKIVSNLPAITVEEVAPTSVSDVTLLAPEEVKKKTGLVKGKTERTDTDRKRERRKKKIHQKLKEKKQQEKLESLKANPSAKRSKLEKTETLKKLKQHRNTKIATVDEAGKIKSSKDFFSRLQDAVDMKNKTGASHKKKKIK